MQLYAGIDPGQTGGIGVIDGKGEFIAAHRWDKADPRSVYNILLSLRGMVINIYLEDVNLPQTGAGIDNQYSKGSNLLINAGIWQGFLISLNLKYQEIAPATWQAANGLFRWKSNQAKGITCHSPLTLARQLWPTAPLEYNLDDGKAVGLLLADLARRDNIAGIDRGKIRAQAQAKAKAKRHKVRQAKKINLGIG